MVSMSPIEKETLRRLNDMGVGPMVEEDEDEEEDDEEDDDDYND